MKKFLLIAALLTTALSMSAQKKGDMYVGGGLSVSGGSEIEKTTVNGTVTKDKDPSSISFTFSPEFGYFILDNLEVNLGLVYGLTSSIYSGSGDTALRSSTHNFMVSPGARYFIPIVDGKFYYTPGAELGLGFSRNVRELSDNTKAKGTTPFIFSLSLNICSFEFRPAEHFGISFSAGAFRYMLSHESEKETIAGVETKTSYTHNSAGLDLNLSASLGMKYYF